MLGLKCERSDVLGLAVCSADSVDNGLDRPFRELQGGQGGFGNEICFRTLIDECTE